MASGFEEYHYHVPQQCRRDKLRDPHYDSSFFNHQPPNFSPSLSNSLQDMNNPFLYHNGLSLSLSSHHHHHNIASSDLSFQRYGGGYAIPAVFAGGGSGSASNDVSTISAPLASVLRGYRFLSPAQELLEELCGSSRGFYVEKLDPDSSLMIHHPPLEGLTGGGGKKCRLISMLDEVYKRYKQYYQQMQTVVASFEYVTGFANAAPYTNFALKTMSRHFKCLKNAIVDQIQFTRKDEAARFDGVNRGFYSHIPVNNPGYLENQSAWRPQRGLPERAVTVLKAWLFEHFLHPYPTDTDKVMLAKQTGLSRGQVSNWFINARVRIWKPMVEEIHMLETRQSHKDLPSANSITSQNPIRIQDGPSKRSRSELHDMTSARNEEPLNMSYKNPQVNFGAAGGSGSVSLTLGLHQNNGIGLSEPFQISAAQYVMGGFEVQHRLLGMDVVGGQLVHDLVG